MDALLFTGLVGAAILGVLMLATEGTHRLFSVGRGPTFTLFVFALGLALVFGCSVPSQLCMTGFEVGVNGSRSDGNWNGGDRDRTRTNDATVGGHATVFFDTTGACRAQEEN